LPTFDSRSRVLGWVAVGSLGAHPSDEMVRAGRASVPTISICRSGSRERTLRGTLIRENHLRRQLVSTLILCALSGAACETDVGGPAKPGGTTAAGGTPTGSSTSAGAGGGVGTSGTGAGGAVGTTSAVGTGGGPGTGGSVGTTTGAGGGGRAGAGGGSSGSGGSIGPVGDGGVGAPIFNPGDLDAPSNGGTITFQTIGLAGSFPSVRDPAVGPCDFTNAAGCCRTSFAITNNMLTPWDEDVIMTLRGPLLVKQLAVYQPNPTDATQWQLASSWDDRTATAPVHMGFNGNRTETTGFNGVIGTECLVDVSTDRTFACGPGSVPFCAASAVKKYYGWQGSKMIVLLSAMPFASSGKVAGPCSTTTTGNWYNAPWVGISLGELIRSGAFSACQCYSKTTGAAGDGCGQFNVFEVVNDNNSFRNFDVFSTNFIGYAGYVGEGPCGGACNATLFPAAADLVSKSTSLEAAGVVSGPGRPVGAALRRPENGYRYFIILMDVNTRTVQLAIVHPQKIPAGFASFLPALPSFVPRATVDAVLAARLPR